MSDPAVRDSATITAAVRRGQLRARTVVEEHLDRIAAVNGYYRAVTTLRAEQALAAADAVDAAVRSDEPGTRTGPPEGRVEGMRSPSRPA